MGSSDSSAPLMAARDVPVQGIDRVAGLLPNNITLAQNLLLSLSGSVDTVVQKFEIKEPTDTKFLNFKDTFYNDAHPNHGVGQIRNWAQNEVNFFVKDDWKVTPSLTLNLGLRYDLMRVPYIQSTTGQPFTPGIIGGSQNIFGYSGNSIGSWMSGGTAQKGELTKFGFIGDGTQYPKQGVWPSDRNNWGPAVGFAWSPNFGGKDKTTIRGGYQIAYQLPGNSLVNIDGDIGKATPGLVYNPVDRGDGTFRDFSNIVYPLPVNQAPFQTIPLAERSQSVFIFAPDYTTPYVQTLTLGVTRSLAPNVTVDVRYIGTHGLKLHSTLNLNSVDFRNNGLAKALDITRNGGDAPMFDQMMNGLNMGAGIGIVGVNVTGSEALRRHASTRTAIANGDFATVATFLNTTNTGTVQPRGQIIAGGLLRSSGSFPENFFVVNPQFAGITYRNNSDSSNYHSLQNQITLRPTKGITYQATYTWSRALGVFGNYRDVMNQDADYTLQSTHRTHDFRSYGTFDLPFGPGKLIARNSSGFLARLVEGWRLGTILNLTSGAPLNVVGQSTLYAQGTPDVVGAFPRQGSVVWPQNTGRHLRQFLLAAVQTSAGSGMRQSGGESETVVHADGVSRQQRQHRSPERGARTTRHARFAFDGRARHLGFACQHAEDDPVDGIQEAHVPRGCQQCVQPSNARRPDLEHQHRHIRSNYDKDRQSEFAGSAAFGFLRAQRHKGTE